MDSAMVMEKMYYIIDGKGNYYRMNDEDQLIVSQDKETADLFDLKEANKRINSGRKMYFYSILPADTGACVKNEVILSQEGGLAEETDEAAASIVSSPIPDVVSCAKRNTTSPYQYDLEQLDWKEYLLHFSFVVSGLKKYQDKLNKELSEVDMCICDLMHYLELYDLEDKDYIKAASLIKQYREKRRVIKDKAHMAECFQKTIGTNNNLAKAREAMGLINKLDRRTYKPRVLSEIFTDTLVRSTKKEHFVEKQEETENPMEQKEENREVPENMMTVEYSDAMERRETIFDNKENDWRCFASEQAAFFAEAKQYVCNLQITLNELDEEIEQVLYQIEEANCNVAQGYKVFKMLKDLRNERKRVVKELESVQTITQCFDCEAMRDAYRYCEERIGEIQERR